MITWTPWAGARVTELAVPGDADPHGLKLQTVGGNPAAAPLVSRHVNVSASIDMTDDETFGSDEHGHEDGHGDAWVDSLDPLSVIQLVGVCGGEMRVELNATAVARADGSARVSVEAKLFEGTSETTSDLDGVRTSTHIIPVDQVLQVPIRVNNDDEGGDFADINLAISNSST